MANSKAFLLLGLVLAVVLVISSEVSAREVAETAQTQETVKPNTVESANGEQLDGHGYGHGYGHGHGHGHGGKPGHGGHPGHGAAGEELEVEN
ncbi:Glycine-rich protein [Morella rubra]|uniref:Glycine-rich protein n=1 Tax=Morella rubra TaxID=262757 RepID=A0A6A1VSV5_9ROSI|nr:Glycine-rich protein [Morella rubra]